MTTLLRHARWVLLALSCLVGPASAAPPSRVIDVNAASETELTELPGIGPKKARAILDERQRNGPFSSVDDLERVRGIGPATIDRLRAWASAGAVTGKAPPALPAAPESYDEEPEEPPARPAPRDRTPTPPPPRPLRPPPAAAGPVDVNLATAEELARLPGVSAAIAAKVVAARPHRGIDDLARAGVPNAAKLAGRVRFQVDVNRATVTQLVALGVPLDAARKAVELRELAGGFASVQELASVPGIRPELVASLSGVLVARPR